MERFTEKFKDGRNILRNGIADIFHIGFGRYFEGEAVDKLSEYEDLEGQGLLLRLSCKVGDTMYVDSKTIPTENMDFEKVKDIPLYFKAIVVSLRKNSNGTYIKLKVKAKWLHEWIDPECGPDSCYYEVAKYFTYPLSAIGKTIFLTQAEAEAALKRMKSGE